MRLIDTPDGVRIDCRTYSITFQSGRPYARLADATGTRLADLALLAAVDSAEGPDETSSIDRGDVGLDAAGWRVEIESSSTRWARKRVVVHGDERWIWFEVAVEGEGCLTDVRLVGGVYSGDPRHGTGEWLSGASFATVFSPEPADPARIYRPAAEPASLDVLGGGGRPGMGHWFFTPPPFCFGFAAASGERDAGHATAGDAARSAPATPAGPWMTLGLAAAVDAMTFTSFRYEPAERAFSLVLRYEGQTRVDGEWRAPALLLRFGDDDPYYGLAQYARELRRLGYAPAGSRETAAEQGAATDEHGRPRWWSAPIFCGWGAQSREANETAPATLGTTAVPHFSRQDLYDRWLAGLAEHGLVPGTVVIDDKWQAAYGDSEPDPEKWPDLRRWIAGRHADGQRVLLWWKAWDPDGLPPELCIRNREGRPVAADPSNPAYEARLRKSIRRLLGPDGPDGLDADGLKIDFTAQTPSGSGLRRHGKEWGVALLHRLLSIVADEARSVRSDALIVTHTPNPAFGDVAGMLRLNDMLRFDEPDDPAAVVPQMQHRARVVRAACPNVLVDTDDWCAPDLATWRSYQRLKPEIGVPALYYAEGLDRSREPFEPADYELLREVWAACSTSEPAAIPESAAGLDSAPSRGTPDA